MTFRLYVPTDCNEASDVLELKGERVKRGFITDYFSGSWVYHVGTNGRHKEIVINDINILYGADLQQRFGFRLNPMSVIEFPDKKTLECAAKKFWEKYGWVAIMNEQGETEEKVNREIFKV